MATTKKATKKTATKKGIVLTKTSKGITVSIYGGNGRHLFQATGYNNVANARKGLSALHDALIEAFDDGDGSANGYAVTDLTKPAAKKAAPKKKA